MSSLPKNWFVPEEDALRASLQDHYEALAQDAEEGALVARGIDNRQSAFDLAVHAAFRIAEHYSSLKTLVRGAPLPDNPAKLAVCVILMPSEIEELADLYDVIAANAEANGDHVSALKRRERAEVLRTIAQVRS